MRAILSLMCLAIPIAASADSRSPIDRARAIDPGHDTGTLLPRADTLDEGAIAVRGLGMVGAHTVSYVPLADLQVSLTAVTIAGQVSGWTEMPLILSAKYAVLRTDHLALAVQGNVLSIVGERFEVGPAVGLLADWYIDDRGEFAIHAGLQSTALAHADDTFVAGVADATGATWALGMSWRADDVIALVFDVHGSVRVDGDRVQNGEGPVMTTALRAMGTHWGVDLGVLLVVPRPSFVPLINLSWRN